MWSDVSRKTLLSKGKWRSILCTACSKHVSSSKWKCVCEKRWIGYLSHSKPGLRCGTKSRHSSSQHRHQCSAVDAEGYPLDHSVRPKKVFKRCLAMNAPPPNLPPDPSPDPVPGVIVAPCAPSPCPSAPPIGAWHVKRYNTKTAHTVEQGGPVNGIRPHASDLLIPACANHSPRDIVSGHHVSQPSQINGVKRKSKATKQPRRAIKRSRFEMRQPSNNPIAAIDRMRAARASSPVFILEEFSNFPD